MTFNPEYHLNMNICSVYILQWKIPPQKATCIAAMRYPLIWFIVCFFFEVEPIFSFDRMSLIIRQLTTVIVTINNGTELYQTKID